MLSDAQRDAVRALFESMKAEAVPLGEKLIAQEIELDRQFAAKIVTEASLARATQAIGATQAALRAAHLKYHLATIKALTPEQVQRYGELRGYAKGPHGGRDHGQHKH
jgi:Spy/CpxP family protein refolding chaperone